MLIEALQGMNEQNTSSRKCENISGGSRDASARVGREDSNSNCTQVELCSSVVGIQPNDDTLNQRNCGNNEKSTEFDDQLNEHRIGKLQKLSRKPRRSAELEKRPLSTISVGEIKFGDSNSTILTSSAGENTSDHKLLNEVRITGEQSKANESTEPGFDRLETRDSRVESKDLACSCEVTIRKRKNIGIILLDLLRCNRPKIIDTKKTDSIKNTMRFDQNSNSTVVSRALPPTPVSASRCMRSNPTTEQESPVEPRDFAASLERVKDCGWYWGPLSSEEAENLLKNEPDGSFIVRDSSDAHYIFSLTFKLNGSVRHVRIEHDQGNFSFGPLTKFKASTIVEFVEKAVAHSRSGRYLFFLHRRPALGPMQVQLLHPYSRFRHPRSLQHMCRFVILKYVRRDLVHTLPLPKPLQDYLNTPHYYFEQHELSGKLN